MSTTHTGTTAWPPWARARIGTPADPVGSVPAHGLVSGAEAADAQTIATLRAGDVVDGVFACVRKERLITRSGDPYLTIELRDRSGSLSGRVFRDADLLRRALRAWRARAGARACGAVS